MSWSKTVGIGGDSADLKNPGSSKGGELQLQ